MKDKTISGSIITLDFQREFREEFKTKQFYAKFILETDIKLIHVELYSHPSLQSQFLEYTIILHGQNIIDFKNVISYFMDLRNNLSL